MRQAPRPTAPAAASAERAEAWFHQHATHYVESQVLFHLNDVGVFRLLDTAGPLTIDDIARRLDLDPHSLRCCVEYAHGVGELLVHDADGRYGFSDFGRAVLDRYGRVDSDGRCFNFFDVRVGSYGPVWAAMGRLMRRDARYGHEVHRAGGWAATGVYKVAAQLMPAVSGLVQRVGLRRLVEFGVPTGLLARAVQAHPGLTAIGVDRDPEALTSADQRARELGVHGIRFVRGDFFRPETWLDEVRGEGPAALATIHFHELVADGGAAVQRTLRTLHGELPGWYVVAFEQPRLPESARHELSETRWSYAQSNILIHHLIENGRILSDERWQSLFLDAGCELVANEPIGYLGYHMYVFRT